MVSCNEQGLEQQSPAGLVLRIRVPHPPRQLLRIAEPGRHEPPARQRLGGAREQPPQPVALEIGPLFEPGRARRLQTVQELSPIELHRARTLRAVDGVQERRPITRDVGGDGDAPVLRRRHRESHPTADERHGFPQAVAASLGAGLRPEEVDQAVTSGGAVRRAMEVDQQSEGLAGAEQRYVRPGRP